jgi:hypothetical protein
MNEERRAELDEHGDDERAKADLPASTLIGANITGANTGTYVGGVVAPASEAAEIEQKEEDAGEGLGEMNFDALAQFAPGSDEDVSKQQSEVEADEQNS